VYDGPDFVGILATPAAEAFTDHSDMFAVGDPAAAYVTSPDGFGFVVNAFDESFVAIKHDVVMYTGPDCTGTPVDYFATHLDLPGDGLTFDECDDAAIEPLLPMLELHYGLETDVGPFVQMRWPGGSGLLVRRDNEVDSVVYKMPVDQPWPSRVDVLSGLTLADGSCENYGAPVFVCAIEFADYGWTPPVHQGGPYSLVMEP
jgi:hypothetical protein